MLIRDQILAMKPEIGSLRVPEVEGPIYVKEMTAGERDAFEVAHAKSGEKDFRARLAAATICDEDGRLLFGPGDIAALSAIPASVLEPIVQMAVAINRLSKETIEDLEKNLPSGRSRRLMLRYALAWAALPASSRSRSLHQNGRSCSLGSSSSRCLTRTGSARQICQVMASLWSKGTYQVEDFIPRQRAKPRRMTPEESAGYLKRAVHRGS